MPVALLVVGFVIMVLGIAVMFLPAPKPNPEKMKAQGFTGELAVLVDKFDKRYRPGIVLLFVGLAVASMGVYLEVERAKQANKEPAALSATVATSAAEAPPAP